MDYPIHISIEMNSLLLEKPHKMVSLIFLPCGSK